MKRITFAALGLLVATIAPGRAQDPPADPARLQALLQELGKLDPKVWAARVAALEQAATAEEARAKDLRAQATKLQEQALAADAAAKQVRAEIARLQELHKLLKDLGPPKVEPAAAAPTPAPAAASAAPPPATPPHPTLPKASEPETKEAASATTFVDWSAVEPLLQDRCSSCHEPSDKKGGLDVTTFAALRQGGGSGRTLVPGEPDQSRLFLMVAQQERPFMPKGEDPLAAEQVALLRHWIEQGASETTAAARAFVAAREAAARTAVMPPGATAAAGPLPADLPSVELAVPERPAAVKSLARSPTAALLAMPGIQQVLLFDAAMQPLGVLPLGGPSVEALAFAPDGTQLVAAVGERGRRGAAAVFDVATGKALGVFGSDRDVPLAVAVHARAGLVALGGASKRAQVLRLKDGAVVAEGAHDDFVLAMQFSPDGTLLAAADRAGEVRLWETSGGGLVETLAGHRGAVHAIAYAAAGNQVATAGADGTVRVFDPATGKEVWRQQAHEGQATGVAFLGEGRVASCGSDGRIVVMAPGGKVVAKSPVAGEWLYAVAAGAEANTLWAGDWQGRVHRFVVGGKQKVMDVLVPLRSPR